MFITLTRYSNGEPVYINVDQVLQVHELEHQQGERSGTAVYVGPNGANGDAGPVVVKESMEQIRKLLGAYLSPRSMRAISWRREVERRTDTPQGIPTSLPDLATSEFVTKALKDGAIAKVAVAHVAGKTLYVLFDGDEDGSYEVSTLWEVSGDRSNFWDGKTPFRMLTR